MKPKSFADMTCSIASALDIVGDRWTLLILRDLFLGLARHDDFIRSTGIPPTTLSSRLRLLEEQGMVVRTPYQSNPPRFSYRLAARGRAAWPVLVALAQWGDEHGAGASAGPPIEFVDGRTGTRVRMAAIDAQSGAVVPPEHLEARPGAGADDVARWRIERGRQARKAGF